MFYYVCPAVTSDLIARPETTGPMIGASTPVEVVGQCINNASPENVRPGLTCSQKGVWSVNSGADCVCDSGFSHPQMVNLVRVCCLSVCLVPSASTILYVSFPLKGVIQGCT